MAYNPFIPVPAPIHQVFRMTDWECLRKQKALLVNNSEAIADMFLGGDCDLIEGLICFLDHVQDAAAEMGYPANPGEYTLHCEDCGLTKVEVELWRSEFATTAEACC